MTQLVGAPAAPGRKRSAIRRHVRASGVPGELDPSRGDARRRVGTSARHGFTGRSVGLRSSRDECWRLLRRSLCDVSAGSACLLCARPCEANCAEEEQCRRRRAERLVAADSNGDAAETRTDHVTELHRRRSQARDRAATAERHCDRERARHHRATADEERGDGEEHSPREHPAVRTRRRERQRPKRLRARRARLRARGERDA